MEIYQKAQELALAIAQSREFKRLREKTETIAKNTEAQGLIKLYQDFQMEYIQEGIEIQDLPVDKQLEIESIEEKMTQNSEIIDYLEAENQFEQIVRSVNLILSSALNYDQELNHLDYIKH